MSGLVQVISQLKQIRKVATMESASFHVGNEPFPFGADVTDLVRQATHLWRFSWIVDPLDKVIDELEQSEKQSK